MLALPPQDAPAPTGAVWKSSVALGLTASAGNTDRRSANLSAELARRHGPNRTSAKFAWDYAQKKDDTDVDYELDQRHVQGDLKHDYFFSEKTYAFVGAGAENDFGKNITLRYTATAGLGVQVIDEAELSFALEVGAGYVDEESSLASNVNEPGSITARVSTNLVVLLTEKLKLTNILSLFPSLEDGDDVFGTSDTRLDFPLGEGSDFRGQFQWILDYDNTPSFGGSGMRNDRMDHRLLFNLVLSF
jgi:putative salt-induced outer membrane protein YdiY